MLKVKGSRDTVDTPTKVFIESDTLCLHAGKKACIQVVRAERPFSLHFTVSKVVGIRFLMRQYFFFDVGMLVSIYILHVEMNTSSFRKKVKNIIEKQNIISNHSSV